MSARKSSGRSRTWIEIDASAARHNYRAFRRAIGPKVKLWAVVKSNAYGHGLFLFSRMSDRFGVDGFCVDSLIEAQKLRRTGIRKPILVLGPTLPGLFPEAARDKITLTIASLEHLKLLLSSPRGPEFHLKFDTGMHRQGFYPEDAARVIRMIQSSSPKRAARLRGLYTHFAAAGSPGFRAFTERQFQSLLAVREGFCRAGFEGFLTHAANTGGVLANPRYHLDAVRVGLGLYGFSPNPSLGSRLHLRPVLAWRTILADAKPLRAGDRVGYDLTARVPRPTMLGILPVGYWHGLPRSLSRRGEVIVADRKAKFLGRISMDLSAIDLGPRRGRTGTMVTLIGSDGRNSVPAPSAAAAAGTVVYELLTRLNPLIERVLI